MTEISTDLGATRESARSWRVEPNGNITETNVQTALEQVAAQADPGNAVPVIVTAASHNVTDERVIYVNYAGLVNINLPTAASRANADLVIKDTSGAASTNNIRINPNAADTGDIDGLDPLTIDSDYGAFEIRPDILAWRVTT